MKTLQEQSRQTSSTTKTFQIETDQDLVEIHQTFSTIMAENAKLGSKVTIQIMHDTVNDGQRIAPVRP